MGDFVQLHDKAIKLRSVKSILGVDTKSKMNEKFYGCVSNRFSISNLPPEMIAKLDAKGAEKYISYWSQTASDYNIANELTPEQVKESEEINNYLEEGGYTFVDFWNRVQKNAALWKRIQPRQVDGDYYVVKCFRAGVDGSVHLPKELPYELVPISIDLDIWFYDVLIFEFMTGESLLHSNNSMNIVNDSDFEKLFNWTMTDYLIARRLDVIKNPLGRHLLRSLLTSPNKSRQRDMELVLKHQFFNQVKGLASPKLCKQIVQVEKEEARKYKVDQYMKLRKFTLAKRTEKLSLICTETQLRFENSQWKLLKSIFDLSDITFPTSLIVLPYELETTSSGELQTPAKNIPLCCKVGLIIADIMHYLHYVTDIKQKWDGKSFSYKTKEYMEKNLISAPVPEDNLVRICEGVVRKAKNATTIVTDVLSNYVSSGDGTTAANKLIADILRDIVDLEVCDKVVTIYEATQENISLLLETIGDKNEKAQNMMNEQVRDAIGVDFAENSFARKESIQTALMSSVESIAENPLAVMEGLLKSRIHELVDLYKEIEICHIYLVDEYSGLPVASGVYPLTMNFSTDIFKTLIIPTVLAMRSSFPLGIIQLLGLSLKDLPEQWSQLAKF